MIGITFFLAVMGVVVGSFLNVVVLRLHAGRNFVKGRSVCPYCRHELGAIELIPILSWLGLRGRCRHCHKPISIQYPLVEALTALIFVLIYVTHPASSATSLVSLLIWLYVASSFIVLAVYDARWYLLPDKVLLPLLLPAAALILLQVLTSHSVRGFIGPIMAAVVFGGFFYLTALVSKGRWMGGGDIKLVFIMGLLLGLQKTTLAMLIATDSAAIIGLALIASHRKKRTDVIPFGPFLILGALVAYLYGGAIIEWYLGITGLNVV